MTNNKFAAALAASATALALAGAAFAAERPANSSGSAVGAKDTVHCYGVNSCKGTADCKTSANECKGHNECKNQGFKAMAAAKCLTAGGVIGDIG